MPLILASAKVAIAPSRKGGDSNSVPPPLVNYTLQFPPQGADQPGMRHLRRNKRTPYSGAIEVSWVEPGREPRFARGRCLDLSEDGLRLELPVALPLRAVVTLRFERIQLRGTASVRYLRRAGMKFVLGFELSQHLRQLVVHKLEILQPLSSSLAS